MRDMGLAIARTCAFMLSAALAIAPFVACGEESFAAERERMVGEIRANASYVGKVGDHTGTSARVLDVMGTIPRHLFVPETERASAYEDRPLPIGYGQTISQPYIVALMTDLVDPERSDIVLEIGTGSGYQAAVLSPLVAHVYTIEIVPELTERAERTLRRLHFDNVTVRHGDGYHGWPEKGPFDAIIVTAAASHIPPPLIRQLKPGGRMVIPVSTTFFVQRLMLVEKDDASKITTRHLLPVRFVPLTGGH